jgi:hypothetical protein
VTAKTDPAAAVDDRRQRIRRNVLLLAGLALAFYFGFIWLVVTR